VELVNRIPFVFEEQEYEIRIYQDGMIFKVRAFLNEEPANGYTYEADFSTRIGLKRHFGLSAIDNLIEDAKADIRNKTWQRLLEALQREG